MEWPTVGLFVACYGLWFALIVFAETITPWLAVPLLAVVLAFHSSLQHEAIHGHPTRVQWLNDLIAGFAVGLIVPYERFRALHLAHHRDAVLTDPYDDPESAYLDPAVWKTWPRWRRRVAEIHNTLIGRMLIGPALGAAAFIADDLKRARSGEARAILRAWGLHGIAVAPVIACLIWVGTLGLGAYLIAAYGALALLRIRTFAEHRAHVRSGARSVVIEDRGPLALLFLNNNLHVVHHACPDVAWYDLPGLYRARRARFLAMNGGYRFENYAALFRAYAVRRKDPVAHPFYPWPAPRAADPVGDAGEAFERTEADRRVADVRLAGGARGDRPAVGDDAAGDCRAWARRAGGPDPVR